MQKRNLIIHLSLGLFLSGIALPVSAAIYKWVDETGRTHYTQSKPPDEVEATTLKSTTKVDTESAQKTLQQQQKKANSALKERQKKAEAAAKQKADAALDNKNCDLAKTNLSRLERPRINLVDDKGETYRAGEDERQRRLKKAREDVAEYCK